MNLNYDESEDEEDVDLKSLKGVGPFTKNSRHLEIVIPRILHILVHSTKKKKIEHHGHKSGASGLNHS